MGRAGPDDFGNVWICAVLVVLICITSISLYLLHNPVEKETCTDEARKDCKSATEYQAFVILFSVIILLSVIMIIVALRDEYGRNTRGMTLTQGSNGNYF